MSFATHESLSLGGCYSSWSLLGSASIFLSVSLHLLSALSHCFLGLIHVDLSLFSLFLLNVLNLVALFVS